MVRIGTIIGGVIFGGAILGPYIMPFLPLIITIAASIITGLCIKKIFITKMNKRFNQPYRFTNATASASNQQTGGAMPRCKTNCTQSRLLTWI
jgi:predicted lipid-binding transport protein (Tim44 family)